MILSDLSGQATLLVLCVCIGEVLLVGLAAVNSVSHGQRLESALKIEYLFSHLLTLYYL